MTQNTSKMSRRRFLSAGCTAAAALAGSRLVSVSFAARAAAQQPAAAGPRDVLLVLFLRGGMDGLNLVAPVADRNYIEGRAAALRLLATGDTPALPLTNGPIDADFRIHPKAAALKELYDSKHLAIVHACGLTNGTRSHFEAQDLMDRGVADLKQQALSTGWLTRHLETVKPTGLLPGIAAASTLPNSLLGYGGAAAISSPESFSFSGDEKQLAALTSAYRAGAGGIQGAGADTLSAIRVIRQHLKHNENGDVLPYAPADGVTYPQVDLSESLKTVACLIKSDVGLEAAAVDYGGWDTHQDQPNTFTNQVDQLSSALGAFWNDVSKYHNRLNVVVMSEFGRRFKSNDSTGTDHGHGNALLVLGGNVNGGKIFGPWPGLATEQLDDRADLAVTTDYRTVLAELLTRRLRNGRLKTVFPGLVAYRPLGLFRGDETPTDLVKPA